MLRVGLTGGLGSGKSTVAGMLAELGAYVLSADEIGRSLMQPGQTVYDEIVNRFGPEVVLADGRLDRALLAQIAFRRRRIEELNAIVHPATIARQGELAAEIFGHDAEAVVVVESALIFETRHGEVWRDRFDRMVLVTAPEEDKVARFVARSGEGHRPALEEEARLRLAQMIPDEEKAKMCDLVIANDESVEELRGKVERAWNELMKK